MGLEFALFGTGLGLGLRHGIDWDHIAAIADVTGAEPRRGRALLLGTLYALGHASVVVALGLFALLAGATLPARTDAVMEIIVGLTLISLGFWLLYSLWRHGASFRLRSRWMLVFAAVGQVRRWIGTKLGRSVHTHEVDEHRTYGTGAAVGIGMIHGVGAETGSQVLLLAAAAGAVTDAAGTLLLIAFVIGLVLSNSLITVGSVLGFWSSERNRRIHLAIGLFAAVFSLAVGFLFLSARSGLLPSILT